MFWTSNLFFIIENWICAMTRHHAEANINILLTRNLPLDSYDRKQSHPLHCFWAKSNIRMHGQFECDITWFCFCFDFVCSHIWCSCCSIVCSHFQVVHIKQVDCKLSTLLCLNKRGGSQIANFEEKTLELI